MNALERLLQDDLNRLIDRMAATTQEGLVAGCEERRPDLLVQLADSEVRLTAARQSMLEAYAVWRDASMSAPTSGRLRTWWRCPAQRATAALPEAHPFSDACSGRLRRSRWLHRPNKRPIQPSRGSGLSISVFA